MTSKHGPKPKLSHQSSALLLLTRMLTGTGPLKARAVTVPQFPSPGLCRNTVRPQVYREDR